MSPPDRGPVLIVEDDPDVLGALRDTLEIEGYEVACAGNGVEALEYLRDHARPALILLDWNMAPMNGAQFSSELSRRPEHAGIPVVVVSAESRLADKLPPRTFAGHLTKPIDLDALFGLLARLVD